MNILILNYEFPPLGGGAANATYYLLKELAKRNDVQVDLVTSSTDKYKVENFSENIKIHFLDIGKKGNVHYQSNKDLLAYSCKAYFYGRKLARKNKYDLTHAFFGIPCGFVAMILGLPCVVSLRGTDVPFYSQRYKIADKLLFNWLSGIIWKNAKAVVANSEGLKELALKSHPKQEISVIYNGVDTDEFMPQSKEDGFVVLSTSRLIERKGINFLLDAFIGFAKNHPDSKLLIAGSGNLEQKLKQRAKDSGISEKIEFLGAIEHSQMAQIYQQSDVFVLASLNEGMSNSLLEAMASGLAIVATDTGGTKELVDRQNGVIIEKGSASSIENALGKLYADKNLLLSLKGSSRRKAEEMSWKKAADQYFEIYKKVQN